MALLRKSKGTDKYPGGSESHIFPCDCGDSHYLRIDRDNDFDDANFLYLDWFYRPTALRHKLKASYEIFRGREHFSGGLVLTQEVADQVIEALKGPYPKPE